MSGRGSAGWSATYCKQYGKERWRVLLNALAEVPTQLAFVAPNISHSAFRYLLRRPRFLPCLVPNCFIYGNISQDDAGNASTLAGNSGLPAAAWPGESETRTEGSTSRSCGCGTAAVPCKSVVPVASGSLENQEPDTHLQVDDDHVVEEAREKTYFLGDFVDGHT